VTEFILYCPYCKQRANLVDGSVVYPTRPDLHDKLFYYCPEPCDALVGCHPGTHRPLGTLANATLRRARMTTHSEFDQLWKAGRFTRQGAYKWLATQMKMKKFNCHIARFNLEECQKTMEIIRKKRAGIL
jgi:hypothetical protein